MGIEERWDSHPELGPFTLAISQKDLPEIEVLQAGEDIIFTPRPDILVDDKRMEQHFKAILPKYRGQTLTPEIRLQVEEAVKSLLRRALRRAVLWVRKPLADAVAAHTPKPKPEGGKPKRENELDFMSDEELEAHLKRLR